MNPDVLLLSYIAFFGFLCGVLIVKKERLGWAMGLKNMTYGVAFGWGALMVAIPSMANEDIRRSIRIIVALAITWAIYELIAVRVRYWKERED